MRRGRRSPEANLDSLLDTMANVTGILIFVLAVSQLITGDAVGRVQASLAGEANGITRDAFDAALEEAQRLDAELTRWREEDLAEREAQARALAATLSEEIGQLEAEVALAGVDAQELRRRVGEIEGRAADLERAVSAANEDRDLWSARLASLDANATRRTARLPDPRPAPSGARRIVVLCRYGRVMIVDDRRLIGELWRGVEEALGRPRHEVAVGFLPTLERFRLTSHFSRFPVGAGGLRWQLPRQGALSARLEWTRRTLGEPAGTLALDGAAFRRELARTSPSLAYFEYFVWADSFDAYTTARRASDAAGFAAGWQAFERDEDIFHDLGRRQGPRRLID